MLYSSSDNKKPKKYEFKMSGVKLESIQYFKDLGVTITSTLKLSQHCKYASSKDHRILGYLNKKNSFKNENIISPLYMNLLRLHLEYAVQYWTEWLFNN